MRKENVFPKIVQTLNVKSSHPKKENTMVHIHPFLLLAFSIGVTLLYGILRNQYSKKHVETQNDYYAFNCLSSVFSALVLVLFSGGFKDISGFTVWLGILFGIATAGSAILNLQALKIGPMSYTTVIIASAMILPALSGGVVWGESISVW